jgi:hypothetical protein
MKTKMRFQSKCRFVIFVLLIQTLIFAASVKTYVGKNINFADYHTYTWLPTKVLTNTGIVENDPVGGPIIRSAINEELTSRGLKEVPSGGDLQVATIVLTGSSPQLEGYLFAGGWAGTDWGYSPAAIGRYNKDGTLGVNLIDSRTNKSAWAGLITESIDNKTGGNEKKIPPAAKKLFAKYPIKKK